MGLFDTVAGEGGRPAGVVVINWSKSEGSLERDHQGRSFWGRRGFDIEGGLIVEVN